MGVIAANHQVMVSPRYKADPAPAVYLACVLLFSPALAVALIGLSRPRARVPSACAATRRRATAGASRSTSFSTPHS